MAIKMALSCANIFVGRFERNLKKQKRNCLNYFLTFANSSNNSIKFTVDITSSKKVFFDTSSTLEDGEIR